MARESHKTRIDDQPEARESPVRHAHALEASRHGRASTPGYLGLPADADPDGASVREDVGDSDGQRESDEAELEPGTRKPRARARARAGSSSAEATDAGSADLTAETDGAKASKGGGTKAGAASKRRAARDATATRSRRSSSDSSKARGSSKASASKGSASARATPGAAKNTKAQSKPAKSGGARKQSTTADASTKRTQSSPKRTQAKRTPRRAGATKSSRRAAAASSIASRAASALTGIEEDAGKHAAKAAAKGSGKIAGKMLASGARAAGRAIARGARRAGAASGEALAERLQRLPIQKSIDVAVPIDVAWQQWLEFCHFPEGAHRAEDVERDGDELTGTLNGIGSREWRAEVIDERENESFAWRTTTGSDSAGLLTFHELSDRLTRLELELDVRPTDLGEAAALALRVADRRVEAELRRYKADAELLNPDDYGELLSGEGHAHA